MELAAAGLRIHKWRDKLERASLEMLYDVGTHESLEGVLDR